MNSEIRINYSKSFLLSLNNDIKTEVISYLTDEDLACKLSLICREMLKFLTTMEMDEKLWKEKSIRLIGKEYEKQLLTTFGNWKFAYFNLKAMRKFGNIISLTEIVSNDKYKKITWIGSFKNGRLKGRCIRTFCEEEGEFKEGELDGDGTRIFRAEWNRCRPLQTGIFKNGLLHGVGMTIGIDESKQIGIFVNGEIAYGTIEFADGTIWNGTIKHGFINGQGIKIYSPKKERVYASEEGEFIDSNLHGHGQKNFSDSTITPIRGIFEKGRLIRLKGIHD